MLYVAMLIVWVPSTANRVYGLAAAKRNGGINIALNIAAATVLPLQGFLNACIFCFTSRAELVRRFKAPFDMEKRKELKREKMIKEIIPTVTVTEDEESGRSASFMRL